MDSVIICYLSFLYNYLVNTYVYLHVLLISFFYLALQNNII